MPANGALGWPSAKSGEWTGVRCTAGSDGGPPAAGSWSRVSIDRQLGQVTITGDFILGVNITSGEVNWGQLPVTPAAARYVVGGGTAGGAHPLVLIGFGTFWNTASTVTVRLYYRVTDEKLVMVIAANTDETPYLSNLVAGAQLKYTMTYAI